MPDIAMCTGDGCPMKETCYRFKAEPDPLWQSWMFPPLKPDGSCDQYTKLDKQPTIASERQLSEP